MARVDPIILDHLEWLGYVQPTGLVVSAPAMAKAGAILDRSDIDGQRRLREATSERPRAPGKDPEPFIEDFRDFASKVLGWSWSSNYYLGTPDAPVPDELCLPMPDHGVTIRPSYAVRERDPGEGPAWQLLIDVTKPDQGLDATFRDQHLEASPHGRLERLLRHTGVTAGLLTNGRTLRLISAPKGESSGWLDFHVPDMVQTAGRPIASAMRLLLGQSRLLSLPKPSRLAALLLDSRKYQNDVSERLAEQVLHALYELLRGLQAANDASKGALLADVMEREPNLVYRALLTVLLRLVFLLYAEERGMLPQDDAFLKHYSLTGLHDRLREDAALHPDTMDQRFGAWAQLLVVFRMVHDGASTGDLHLPARHGELFDPSRYPFLDGRNLSETLTQPVVPLVSDGTVQRALEQLLVLDGERLSYRALDVEQIGSIYETMMGFRIETTRGRSLAIRAQSRHGAPTVIDLEELLATKPSDRTKCVADLSGRKLSPGVTKAVKDAESLADLHGALVPVSDHRATPDLTARGALVLQPSDERRRSGSHYTPRELTEPIVRTTLEPILERLAGDDSRGPTPEQILDLKVCDPAMGSGAFLVEACRQLGDALVAAWRNHDATITVPVDEDETIYARRLVAQRCLYGVDRNPVAVELAKVSLWLFTLARDHALTFLDHALRHGDSLVGLNLNQLYSFNWVATPNTLAGFIIEKSIGRVRDLRSRIRVTPDDGDDASQRDHWAIAISELQAVRLIGDLAVAAFFASDSPREREALRQRYVRNVMDGTASVHTTTVDRMRSGLIPLEPFHWPIEFPEVFSDGAKGFDMIVGNPPFQGGSKVTEYAGGPGYQQWLKMSFPEAVGQVDLCTFFFRRAHDLLAPTGAAGLLATTTLYHGDSRAGGLAALLKKGATIYSARRSFAWPGQAAVTVAAVHIAATPTAVQDMGFVLDGQRVPVINSHLQPLPEISAPQALASNSMVAHIGTSLGSNGFVLATEEVEELLKADPRNGARIKRLLGGVDLTEPPSTGTERYVIDFGKLALEEARQWPMLLEIVRERVKPARDAAKDHGPGLHGKKYWWQHTLRADPLYAAIADKPKCLVAARVATHWCVEIVAPAFLFNEQVFVFALQSYSALAVLQSRVHEVWARHHSSRLGQAMRYSVRGAFDTFPFPFGTPAAQSPELEAAGSSFRESRSTFMMRHGIGLTDAHSRLLSSSFDSSDLGALRACAQEMDKAVVRAYGWSDLSVPSLYGTDPSESDVILAFEREVLSRLHELNDHRAREERRAGVAVKKKRGSARSG